MVRSCPIRFERLLAIGVDLVLINAVEVFAKNVHGPRIVTDQDLESRDLVEVEGSVITGKR